MGNLLQLFAYRCNKWVACCRRWGSWWVAGTEN